MTLRNGQYPPVAADPAHQNAVAIDAALAALDLRKPQLGSADQPGKDGL